MTDEYPVFHLTCITHRKDPIYAATIVGKPPMEDAWMGKAVERIFLPRDEDDDSRDRRHPSAASRRVFHNLMIVSIAKSYPGQARKVMNAIWSLGQAMFTKCIIVVDEDCDVQDIGEVVLRVANNIDPERDIQFTLGPVDSLDHASRLPNYGSKMGIDATRKWKAEGFDRPWPAMIEMDAATKARVDAIWAKLGLVIRACLGRLLYLKACAVLCSGSLTFALIAFAFVASAPIRRGAGQLPLDGLSFRRRIRTSSSGLRARSIRRSGPRSARSACSTTRRLWSPRCASNPQASPAPIPSICGVFR